MRNDYFSNDVMEFLMLLYKYKVKYVIVGDEAVIYYGFARFTGDIDIFYENSEENVQKLFKTLNQFWNGNIPGIKSIKELSKKGVIFQFGLPPNRIDLINYIDNVEFNEAWINKVVEKIKIKNKSFCVYFIGLNELIKNKETVKRPKDIEDLKYLKMVQSKKK
jgi:predicted nucleotidyltransferase